MKLTKEEVLNRFYKKHNNFYEYTNFEYKSINQHIEIICPLHGKFNQKISIHFKCSCPECSKIKLGNIKRGNIEYYLYKANLIHENRYDYSKIVNFNKIKDKVEIICKEHGSFFTNLDNHINKKTGCRKCNSGKDIDPNYMDKLISKYSDKFDYSKSIYINSSTTIEIICKKHGSFFQTPNNNMRGQNCPKCSILGKANNLRFTLDFYLPKLNLLHENKYDYSKFEYKGFSKKSIIICPKHGEFKQSIMLHLSSGCPMCNQSKGEMAIHRYLTDNKIDFEIQKSFSDCKFKRKLKFDFYLPKYNICIEYDGIYHYKDIFGNLEVAKTRDLIKNNYCFSKGINLIRISYQDFNQINEILTTKFNI